MNQYNWAVLGLGNIAEQTMKALKSCENANLYACASRSLEKATEFAQKLGFQKAYGSYEEAFADPNVDIIYIATPHHLHSELTKQALLNGKNVVCEKPSTVNQFELLELMDISKKQNKFFMEAMWTKFLPSWKFTLDFIKSGKLGKIKSFYADFCMDSPYKTGSRLYEPSLAGGALLDVGIYPLTASIMVASAVQNCAFADTKINSIKSHCIKACTGVDSFESISVDFGDFCGVLTASVDSGCGNHFKSARIVGEKGILHLPEFWYAQKVNFLAKDGTLIEQFEFPFVVNGYEYEFSSAMQEITSGCFESSIHSQKDSLFLIKIMDSLRKEWGIVYPFEKTENCEILDASSNLLFNQSANQSVNQSSNQIEEKIVVYTDGACSGNPGPGGFGAVILFGNKEIPLSGGEKRTTNNRMELLAPITALQTILGDSAMANLPITLITDSQYVKNGIQSWIFSWKRNGWRTANKEPVKNKDLWCELDSLCSKLNVEWKWVKGHAGNKYNEICDTLAVEAAKHV